MKILDKNLLRMEKPITVNVTYNSETKTIHGLPLEIIDRIQRCFAINMGEYAMYTPRNDKGERILITQENMRGIRNIEILRKRKNGLQKVMHTSIENKAEEENKKMMNDIIQKLRNNSLFSVKERRVLVDAFECHSTAIFKKRKLDQSSIINLPPLRHKKTQVDISKYNTKDSFTQTDPLPNVEVENDDDDSNEDLVMTLKRLWNIEKKSTGRIESLMKKTYNDRRTFICLQNPPVITVKEQYPALFCTDQVKKELDRIFYPGKCEEFLANMEKYSSFIYEYKSTADNNLLERIQKAVERAQTECQKSYAEVVGSVFLLTNILEEKFDFIHLRDYKPPTTSNIYPLIDASAHLWKEVFFDELLFHIVVEKQHLCEAPNFLEAILCLMATHFIFNIDYPESCRRTLIVFEKLYLKANDTEEIDEYTSQFIKFFRMQTEGSTSTAKIRC